MNSWSLRTFNFFRLVIFVLTVCVTALPMVPTNSLAAETAVAPVNKTEAKPDSVILNSDDKKLEIPEEVTADDTNEPETSEEGMSTTTKVAIGVGAAVVVGVAVALGGGGGGGGSDSSDIYLPPTVNRLVGPWGASATSNEQTSYTGTYTLYADATHSYDLQFSEGYRITGRGRWEISGYRLTLYNETGSTYVGEFTPGNIQTIRLTTNGGWTLNLTNM